MQESILFISLHFTGLQLTGLGISILHINVVGRHHVSAISLHPSSREIRNTQAFQFCHNEVSYYEKSSLFISTIFH